MGLTAPYRQHNYMGEHASDAAALTAIQASKWDSAGDGTGTPRNGMWYYDNVLHVYRAYINGAWAGLDSNPGFYSQTISSWTASGGIYYADVAHNLGTEDILVQGHLTADKKTIGFEEIERLTTNTVRLWVATQENVRVVVTSSGTVASTFIAKRLYYADNLDSPVNADWKVNALSPASADPSNAALTVRRFDDTTEEGIGLIVEIPAVAESMRLTFKSRAITAPGAARTVGLKLYSRGIPDNASVEAWDAGTALDDIDIPTNANFQYDTDLNTLIALGLTAGVTYQFELTRVAPGGGTDLTGDWALLELGVEFI